MESISELKSSFSSININLTSKCNLSCRYCYRLKTQNTIKKSTNELGLNDINRNPHIKNIVLTGGEPTLYNGLDIILENMKNKNISIITNGINYLPSLKNCNICISLDGLLHHNTYRQINENLYNQIITNIEKYKEYNTVEIHTVINNTNYKDLDYLKEISDIRKSVGLISKLSSKKMQLTQTELRIFNDYIKNLIEKNRYHYNLTSTILSKNQFYERYSSDCPLKPFPEFNLENNTFNFFNISFNDLKSIEDKYELLCKESWNILKKHLSKYNDNYLFDPYVELEYEWYKNY